MKKEGWSKKQIAQNYELGRPLDAELAITLFEKISEIIKTDYDNKALLDAGCGNGRVTLPISKKYPNLKIVGIDKSEEMLSILKKRIKDNNIGNYKAINSDLSKIDYDENHFDFSLISSVLHSMKNWREILGEIIRVTKRAGFLILISEAGDMYDIGLGYKKSKKRDLMEKFWTKYIELRNKHNIENARDSQVGIRWGLGHPELIANLKKEKNLDSVNDFTIKWKKTFKIRDFMKIVELKCWSSMFTVDDEKYQKIVKDLKEWIKEEKISPDAKCVSNFIVNCEVVKLR